MGFVLSRLYRGQIFHILVLKPSSAKRYTVVDEFFCPFQGTKVLFKHAGEYLTYHKILTAQGKTLSVLEMHDHQESDYFWDCIQNMSAIAYFIELPSLDSVELVLQKIKEVKEANKQATLLLIVVSAQLSLPDYIHFRKSIKYVLDGSKYKIVDGSLEEDSKSSSTSKDPPIDFHCTTSTTSTSPISIHPTKDTVSQGFLWLINH